MRGDLLVIDLGSSALKAVLFGADGAPRALASAPVTTRQAPGRRQEQDADEWWSALKDALSLLPGRDAVEALVLSGSLQNLIVLDRNGRPLAPVTLYSDRRLEEDELAELEARLPPDYAFRVGNRLDPAHTILKLMRLERFTEGGVARGAIFQFGAKDALSLRMTGTAAVDPATASTTGLMNFSVRRWDAALVAAAGIDPGSLPEIRPADAVVGPLTPEAAAELGLPAGLPVFNGAGDGAAATWGADAHEPGSAYAYLGTTGWVGATLAQADAAPPRDSYCLADPVHDDRVIVVSPFLTAGAALDWIAAATSMPVDRLLVLAAAEDASPPAPLFLPYLSGERSPFEDSAVRAAFLGLDRAHGAGALAYAVLEGVAFAVRHNLEASGIAAPRLTLVGGGARHALQRQIMADVLDRTTVVPGEGHEMTAVGAMRMVAAKLGIATDGRARGHATVEPRPDRARRHARRFNAYLAAQRFARDHAADLA